MIQKGRKINLVFADSSKSAKLLKRLEKLSNTPDEGYLVVDMAENSSSPLPVRPNTAYKTLRDYIDFSGGFDDAKVIGWINTWSGSKFNNVELKEILSYEAISLYWIGVSPYLFSVYRKVCRKIDMADAIIKAEAPDKVILLNGPDEWEEAIIAICKFRGIRCFSFHGRPGLDKIITLKVKPVLAICYLSIRDYIRKYSAKLVYLFRRKEFPTQGGKKIIFFSQPPYWRNIYDPHLKKERKADDILDNVIRAALEDGNSAIGLDVDYSKGQFRIFFEKLVSEKSFFWFPIEFYYTRKINSLSKQASKGIISKWRNLLKNEAFQKSISYKGMPLFDLIKDNLFFRLIPFNIFCAIRYIETMKSMIRQESPALIVFAYETGPCGRAAVIAADLAHVPTLAIQHGIIHKLHDDYILPERTPGYDKRFLDPPIPARMAIYGEFSKHILTGLSTYPSDRLVVTGQPRYDTLISMTSNPEIRQSVLGRLGIDSSKKIILVATGALGKVRGQIDGQAPMVTAVISSVSGLDDAHIIVKLHPLEKENESRYKKIADDMGLSSRVTVIEEINMFELIVACDLFITQNSTSSYEALIAGKPVLLIDFSSKMSHLPFIEDKVAILANDAESVKDSIAELLCDPEARKNLNLNRKDFIYRHCHKTDGLATKRVLDLMRVMINRESAS